MSEQQTEQTAYDKIREQHEIRTLNTGEHPKQGSHLTLARLKNVSAWKPVSFKHAGETYHVECKHTDMLDNIVAMSNVEENSVVQRYIEARDALRKDKKYSDTEKSELLDQKWQELTDEDRIAVTRRESAQANAILISAIRFPQETEGEYLYLSADADAEDAICINELDRDFIEALHYVYQEVNSVAEVADAVERFREVGTEE